MRHPLRLHRLLPFALLLALALPLPSFAHEEAAESPLLSGPMVGFSDVGEVELWLQTKRPGRAQLRYWLAGAEISSRLSREVATTDEGDRIARFRLVDLVPGVKYDYEVYADGRRVGLSYATSFKTQAIWKWRTDAPDLRAAFGSCAYINDPAADRPGEPYGGGYEIFQAIAAQKPDLMLWLGDDIYYRESDVGTEEAMRRRWARDRSIPELQPLFGSVHQYAIWDDHDFGPNDADRTFAGRETSLRVFRDYWANPQYGTAEIPGVFGRFAWGDVEFFLLDDRYHRTPDNFPADSSKRMFGREQLRWLKEALVNSDATFKVVASGNQMWNPLAFYEALGRYPEEQRELRDFLVQAKISGLVFLTGDRHASELLKVEVPGLYPFYEFTSSPLTSGMVSSTDREKNNPARVPGTWVTDRRSFGLLDVTGPPEDRVMTLRAIDAQGVELWKREIRASELKAPAVAK